MIKAGLVRTRLAGAVSQQTQESITARLVQTQLEGLPTQSYVSEAAHSLPDFRLSQLDDPEPTDTFSAIDTNGDGLIDRAEWDAHIATAPRPHVASKTVYEGPVASAAFSHAHQNFSLPALSPALQCVRDQLLYSQSARTHVPTALTTAPRYASPTSGLLRDQLLYSRQQTAAAPMPMHTAPIPMHTAAPIPMHAMAPRPATAPLSVPLHATAPRPVAVENQPVEYMQPAAHPRDHVKQPEIDSNGNNYCLVLEGLEFGVGITIKANPRQTMLSLLTSNMQYS